MATTTDERDKLRATMKQVDDLVRLATNEGAAENEARNAAMEAARLIASQKLVVVPADVVEMFNKRIDGANGIIRKEREARKKAESRTILAGLGGLIAAKHFKF
jgi:hypothetical protein